MLSEIKHVKGKTVLIFISLIFQVVLRESRVAFSVLFSQSEWQDIEAVLLLGPCRAGDLPGCTQQVSSGQMVLEVEPGSSMSSPFVVLSGQHLVLLGIGNWAGVDLAQCSSVSLQGPGCAKDRFSMQSVHCSQ